MVHSAAGVLGTGVFDNMKSRLPPNSKIKMASSILLHALSVEYGGRSLSEEDILGSLLDGRDSVQMKNKELKFWLYVKVA